ncbi:hypothetical protein MLD38_006799 [Melastoma candidum]|uniref:Uncharacterized protein n=1 Tax=Melastoma candidum TaxID=119954 RepID=A0ACB9RS23_9MYRT|nr:hypothetical protein MLD38_006799 [Melastoma candidum]
MRNVYHSSFVEDEGLPKPCGCPLLPLKSHIKGPALSSEQGRINLQLHKQLISSTRLSPVFFRNFDIKNPVDKLMSYLTVRTWSGNVDLNDERGRGLDAGNSEFDNLVSVAADLVAERCRLALLGWQDLAAGFGGRAVVECRGGRGYQGYGGSPWWRCRRRRSVLGLRLLVMALESKAEKCTGTTLLVLALE